ncbi:MAG: elongation factor Ts [Clostridia bacterium]|nr:elongation factor Ts [Clostridia bacterium]MBR3687054.1 elongation factor Ts [Clostridia bacterium]
MATITAKDVAALRAKTGIGMMECKKALVEADGDMEAAIKLLREKGELKAEAKMATRIAADGIVDVLSENGKTAIVEVNTETDFVAKNDTFKAFVKNLLKTIIASNPANVEELLASDYEGVTVDAKLKELIFQIGEKITIRRFAVVDGVTSTYIHGLGSIGVIVKFDTDCADHADFAEFAKNIALQVGAYPTPYLNREAVPAEVIENEKSIIKAQLANDPKMANKPEKVLDGIITGKLGKFYEGNCLVDMEYVKADDHETVAKYVANSAKAMGGSIAIASFVRFEKGEGIEKKQEDYAAEIAKLSGVKQ